LGVEKERTMTAHTPRPWVAESVVSWGFVGFKIMQADQPFDAPEVARVPLGRMSTNRDAEHPVMVSAHTGRIWTDQETLDTVNANKALIAAAPELLGALQALYRECVMLHRHMGEGNNTKEAAAAIVAGLAAIAKATGGSI